MLPVYHDLELDLDLDLDLQVLVHPASCDNISTSAAKEDHVSMGGFAARLGLELGLRLGLRRIV